MLMGEVLKGSHFQCIYDYAHHLQLSSIDCVHSFQVCSQSDLLVIHINAGYLLACHCWLLVTCWLINAGYLLLYQCWLPASLSILYFPYYYANAGYLLVCQYRSPTSMLMRGTC